MNRKIGLLVIRGYAGALGRPRVAELEDPSVEYVRQVRGEVGADCLIIIRFHETDQGLNDPAWAARRWFGRHIEFMRALRYDPNIAYCSLNEIADSEADAYALFEMTRMGMMQHEGLRSVLGNCSVGCPDFPVWPKYAGVLRAMGPGDLWGLHEYWVDHNDIDNRYHCARWMLVPELCDVPIVVTECGRDAVEPEKFPWGRPGWQLTCNAEEFLNDLRKYGRLLDQFPQVRGGAVFQTGSLDEKWKNFEVSVLWPHVVAEYDQQEVAPVFHFDGRVMRRAAFVEYMRGVKLGGKRGVVMHHTATSFAAWKATGMAQALVNAAHYYEHDQGWEVGPHLFTDDEAVGLLTPMSMDGAGVAGDNVGRIHIEVVGNFQDEPFEGARFEMAAWVAASVLRSCGLKVDALTYHKMHEGTACPGSGMVDVWPTFKRRVRDIIIQIEGDESMSDPVLERMLGDEMQRHIIPLNPAAALEKEAARRNWLPASREFSAVDARMGKIYIVQAFRDSKERDQQYGLYCEIGDWSHVKSFKRAN